MADNFDLSFIGSGGYSSELDESDRKKTWRDDPLAGLKTSREKHGNRAPSKRTAWEERDREEGRARRFHLLGLNAYDRHKLLVNTYFLGKKGIEYFSRSTARDRTDDDVLEQQHRFVWSEADEKRAEENWEMRLAKKYYDKLHKEYCIVDLSNYKRSRNSVGLRWRVEREVVEGKGQFLCGERRCQDKDSLTTWEVNFGYVEQGERKNALVKLRLCPSCARKLNYHHKRKQIRIGKESRLLNKDFQSASKRKQKKHSKETTPKKQRTNDQTENDSNSETLDDENNENDKHVGEEKSIWSGPAKLVGDKTKEDEFDEYLEDMFL
ncbi:protein FRA10AC1-like [Corticium candelabrum]|uniref:protein FRA10AC1-like n=1 Tax=Corticium candelabrum TaxID=121492 RepID=UPI002E26D3CF|nr:protein FRA10AC1-like [Corticium candelabrum]